MRQLYDVLIIGGGVVGSAIAREMSRYSLKIGVLEKNMDVCNETSGRNSGVIHGGFAYDTGTLKARLCVEGNRNMEQLAAELDFKFIRCGKVLVGNTQEDLETLKRTVEQGEANGVRGLKIIDKARLHELAPAVVGEFAMFSLTAASWIPLITRLHWLRTPIRTERTISWAMRLRPLTGTVTAITVSPLPRGGSTAAG